MAYMDSHETDELWMEEALRCAQRALEIGEVPVGAVVVLRRTDRRPGMEPQHHRLAIPPLMPRSSRCARQVQPLVTIVWETASCLLQLSRAPCAPERMVHARIKRLIYGADDPKAGAVHSVMQVLNHPQLNHQIEVRSGVLAGRSAEVLQTFFQKRR